MKAVSAWMFAIVMALSACAALPGSRSITLTTAELGRELRAQFPSERGWLAYFDVRLSDPRIRAFPDSQRLRADFDVRIGDRLFEQHWRAQLALGARVRYEASDHSLRLRDVVLDRFAIDGADDAQLARAARLPAWLIAQGLEDVTVYRLSVAQVDRLQRENLTVGDVRVTAGGLRITLVPASGLTTARSSRTVPSPS